MELTEIISRIETQVPGAVIEARPLGRANLLSVWLEKQSIYQVAELLVVDKDTRLDWLEFIGCMEIDKALLLTYFIRSMTSGHRLALRVSLPIETVGQKSEAIVRAWSVTHAWPMALAFEQELSELFGIYFDHPLSRPEDRKIVRRILPENWVGYPFRKSYVFPMEVHDIPHHRPSGRTSPDEFGVII